MDYQFEITRQAGPVVVLGIFIPALLFSLIYTHYLRITHLCAGLALAVVTALAAITSLVMSKGSVLRPTGHSPDDVAMAGLAWIVMVLVGVGIVQGDCIGHGFLTAPTEAEREAEWAWCAGVARGWEFNHGRGRLS